eukprot:5054985-Amphidinium_carterae.1
MAFVGAEYFGLALYPISGLVPAGTCGFYNFGYRTECFACKHARGNAKINRTGGPSSKPGSPAQKPGAPAGEPPTKSGANAQNNQNSLLTEQTLRTQIP